MADPSVRVDRPSMNQRLVITAVPEFAREDPRSQIVRDPSGAPGQYVVHFLFAVPGKETFRANIDVGELLRSGESLLRAPATVKSLRIDIATIENPSVQALNVHVNDGGVLEGLTVRVEAPSFTGAEDMAYTIAMPLLSWWSYRFDVAIDVTAWQVIEEATDSIRWRFGVLGQERIVDTVGGLSMPRFRSLFAAYREGMNATNSFYRVLCFYKVVEGCRKVRLVRRRESKDPIVDPSDERFPVDLRDLGLTEHERFPFTPYGGRTFGWALEQIRGPIRNAVAHLDPMGESLNTDDFEDSMQCEQAAPVLKHIARVMLRNELRAANAAT